MSETKITLDQLLNNYSTEQRNKYDENYKYWISRGDTPDGASYLSLLELNEIRLNDLEINQENVNSSKTVLFINNIKIDELYKPETNPYINAAIDESIYVKLNDYLAKIQKINEMYPNNLITFILSMHIPLLDTIRNYPEEEVKTVLQKLAAAHKKKLDEAKAAEAAASNMSLNSNINSNQAETTPGGITTPPIIPQPKAVSPYELVSPGEVCTIDRAKNLGVFDSKFYFGKDKGYNAVKTFNQTIDNRDSRNQEICKLGLDESSAYALCIEQYGPGFIRKPGDPGTCMTYDCPPGFEKSGFYCKKEPVLKDARIDKRSRCDERWYDWFTIPNYHLGNKYESSNLGMCYSPCKPGYVPYNGIDPVDNRKYGFKPKTQKDQCVPREQWMGGKYLEGSDYCPLAWIYRMNSSTENVRNIIQSKTDALRQSDWTSNYGTLTPEYDKYRNPEAINLEVSYVADMCGSVYENVTYPTGIMDKACNKLNTYDRLKEAYGMCQKLMKDEKGEMEYKLDDDLARNDKKKIIMKQACNVVFCNRTDLLDTLSQDPICFKAQTVKPGEEEKVDPDAVKEAPRYDTELDGLYNALRMMITIILLPIIFVFIYYFWVKIAWPMMKWLWRKIRGFFNKKTYSKDEYLESVDKANIINAQKESLGQGKRGGSRKKLKGKSAKSGKSMNKLSKQIHSFKNSRVLKQ